MHAKNNDQYKHKHGANDKQIKGKGNMDDNERKASHKKDPKGWSEIKQGEPLTKLANMAVLDNLKELNNDNGTTDPANNWKNLLGADKVAIAFHLKVDKYASFMPVTESHGQTTKAQQIAQC